MWARVFPHLRRYLWVTGRSGRLEWWVIEGLVIAAYSAIDHAYGLLKQMGVEDGMTRILILIALSGPIFWLNVASSVRRLHDRDKSGWWALLYAFPLLGQLWQFIECGFLSGRDHGNRFNDAPEPDSSQLTVLRARPPSKVLMIVTATVAMGLLASTCMTVKVTEIGPSDRLPGDFARPPDGRP